MPVQNEKLIQFLGTQLHVSLNFSLRFLGPTQTQKMKFQVTNTEANPQIPIVPQLTPHY